MHGRTPVFPKPQSPVFRCSVDQIDKHRAEHRRQHTGHGDGQAAHGSLHFAHLQCAASLSHEYKKPGPVVQIQWFDTVNPDRRARYFLLCKNLVQYDETESICQGLSLWESCRANARLRGSPLRGAAKKRFGMQLFFRFSHQISRSDFIQNRENARSFLTFFGGG